MTARRLLVIVIVAATVADSTATHADLITLDLCPAATTSNRNISGSTLSGDVAIWGTYRDYQIQLLTSSGSAGFDSFVILLSAQLRQSTSDSHSLRGSPCSGPLDAAPLLANALTTIPVSNALISSSRFSSKVESSAVSAGTT